MIEVVVSMAILGVGILALLTLLPSATRLAGHSDFLGRASGILINQLHIQEAMVLNPNITISPGAQPSIDVYPSGNSVQGAGDVRFTVNTTLQPLGTGNAWLIRVNVTWPGNSTGISETLRVVRQEKFRQ